MYTKKTIFIFKSIIKNILHYYLSKNNTPSSEMERSLLGQIKKDGFVIIPNFFSNEECSLLRKEVDSLFEEHNDKLWTDELKADKRLFGIENVSAFILEKFKNSPFINTILNSYEKSTNKSMTTMAGKIQFIENNLGSGQGWHRDRADYKQTKSIIYLSDVSEENGPFQYIHKSHSPIQILKDCIKYKINPLNSRVSDSRIEKLISAETDRIKTLTAKAGTLIIADVRGIHRGSPIKSGQRYALTNYAWWNSEIPAHIKSLIIQDY